MRQLPVTAARFSLYGALTFVAACGGSSAASPQTSTAGSAGVHTGSAGAANGAGAGAGGTNQAGQAGAGAGGTLSTAGASATTAGTAASAGGDSSSGQAGAGGAGGTTEPTGPFKLFSPSVDEGGMTDLKFRCTGDNVTPAFDWNPGPADTQSYAITMLHVGSQSVHWVLWDIPATTVRLPENIAREAMPATPAGSKQIKPNLDGATWYGYTGPCPGSANQSYTFSLYALDVATLPGITPESTSAAAHTAVKAHQLAVSQITVKASK